VTAITKRIAVFFQSFRNGSVFCVIILLEFSQFCDALFEVTIVFVSWIFIVSST
jgi:hypothetical protein